MDFNIYYVLIFVTGFSIGSIITSVIYFISFRKTIKKMKITNGVQNDTIRNLLNIEDSKNIPVKNILGKNF